MVHIHLIFIQCALKLIDNTGSSFTADIRTSVLHIRGPYLIKAFLGGVQKFKKSNADVRVQIRTFYRFWAIGGVVKIRIVSVIRRPNPEGSRGTIYSNMDIKPSIYGDIYIRISFCIIYSPCLPFLYPYLVKFLRFLKYGSLVFVLH